MTDWDSVSDDEFVEEAQRRVNRGHWSPDRYLSQHQSDDRAKLDILRSAIIRANIEAGGKDPVLQALATTCDQLDAVRGNPLPDRAWAINTTFVGKDTAFQEHRPT